MNPAKQEYRENIMLIAVRFYKKGFWRSLFFGDLYNEVRTGNAVTGYERSELILIIGILDRNLSRSLRSRF